MRGYDGVIRVVESYYLGVGLPFSNERNASATVMSTDYVKFVRLRTMARKPLQGQVYWRL